MLRNATGCGAGVQISADQRYESGLKFLALRGGVQSP